MHPLTTSFAAARGSGGASPRLVKTALAAGLLTGGLAFGAQAADAHQTVAHQTVKVKVEHQTLVVRGTKADDRIALRLRAGDPQTLQVDVGDNGSADFQVARDRFNRIRVNAGRGDDLVRVDESNGAFTTTTPTQLNGQRGNDTLVGGSGADTLNGGDGND
jgi:Ca2+-binding RTX toxin-like protein